MSRVTISDNVRKFYLSQHYRIDMLLLPSVNRKLTQVQIVIYNENFQFVIKKLLITQCMWEWELYYCLHNRWCCYLKTCSDNKI